MLHKGLLHLEGSCLARALTGLQKARAVYAEIAPRLPPSTIGQIAKALSKVIACEYTAIAFWRGSANDAPGEEAVAAAMTAPTTSIACWLLSAMPHPGSSDGGVSAAAPERWSGQRRRWSWLCRETVSLRERSASIGDSSGTKSVSQKHMTCRGIATDLQGATPTQQPLGLTG